MGNQATLTVMGTTPPSLFTLSHSVRTTLKSYDCHPHFPDEMMKAEWIKVLSIKVTESFAIGLLQPNRSKRRSLRRCHFHSKLGSCPDTQYLLWASVSQPWEDRPRSRFPSSLRLGACCSCPQGGRLCFECSAALAGLPPGSALFCFCCWTHYRHNPGSSTVEPQRFPPSPNCWLFQ